MHDRRLQRLPDSPPSWRALGRMVLDLRQWIASKHTARLDELERRLASIEAALAGTPLGADALPTYKGVFRAGETYREHDLVTDHGSLWACRIAATTARPGSNPQAWQLAVKRGFANEDRH